MEPKSRARAFFVLWGLTATVMAVAGLPGLTAIGGSLLIAAALFVLELGDGGLAGDRRSLRRRLLVGLIVAVAAGVVVAGVLTNHSHRVVAGVPRTSGRTTATSASMPSQATATTQNAEPATTSITTPSPAPTATLPDDLDTAYPVPGRQYEKGTEITAPASVRFLDKRVAVGAVVLGGGSSEVLSSVRFFVSGTRRCRWTSVMSGDELVTEWGKYRYSMVVTNVLFVAGSAYLTIDRDNLSRDSPLRCRRG